MSSDKNKSLSAESDAPELSTNPGVRTVISLLLIIHLTAIAMAIGSDFYPMSELRFKLGDAPVLSQYMRTLNQQTAYNNHLTYGGGLDVDHFVELEIQPGLGASSESEPMVLNPFAREELPFLIRNRYKNLTQYMAQTADSDEVGGILPLTISARLLNDQGIDSGAHTFRLKSLLLLDTGAYSDPTILDPNPYADDLYRTLYSAKIFEYDNKWLLNKAVAAGQTAPVRSLAPNKQTQPQKTEPQKTEPQKTGPNQNGSNKQPNNSPPAPLKKDS